MQDHYSEAWDAEPQKLFKNWHTCGISLSKTGIKVQSPFANTFSLLYTCAE